MRNLSIVLTFFALWLSTQLSPTVQDYLAYILILTIGVLHGANDITLIGTVSNSKKLFLAYLAAMVFVSFLFLISKGIALLFSILISAYHFGEQHLGEHIHGSSNLSSINIY